MYLSHVCMNGREEKQHRPLTLEKKKRSLKAVKVLPHYPFLSQGHGGMCPKMDFIPTLTLCSSQAFLGPSSPFNGLHMATKWRQLPLPNARCLITK